MNQDFSKRIAIIVRRDIEPWQVTNTIAHIAAKVGRAVPDFETGDFFKTKDGFNIPRNTQYPIVVFQTEGITKIRNLLIKIQAEGLPYLAYIREMIDYTSDEELLNAVQQKNEEEIEYLGIGTFGDNEVLRLLTKKLSLWK